MRRVHFALLIAVTVATTGCSATREGRAKDIKFSGFLTDYSHLKKSNDSSEADYIYIRPGLDLSRYTRVILDPAEARMSDKMRQKIGEKDLAHLLTAFNKAVLEEVGKRWEIVTAPGPDVLHARFALTELDPDVAVLTPFTRIWPVGLVAGGAFMVAGFAPLNAGKVNGEAEFVDSLTLEQLMAAVDRRTGANAIQDTLTKWGDVKAAFNLWAARIVSRLEKEGMRTTTSS